MSRVEIASFSLSRDVSDTNLHPKEARELSRFGIDNAVCINVIRTSLLDFCRNLCGSVHSSLCCAMITLNQVLVAHELLRSYALNAPANVRLKLRCYVISDCERIRIDHRIV